jgi:hypothetical protein
MLHKFNIGQSVSFVSGGVGRVAAIGDYRVIRLLPADDGDFQYRIKSLRENYERVAKESQLERSF